jgi:transposase-like protein
LPTINLKLKTETETVNPANGTCTNLVENYWKNCKRRFKHYTGVHDTHLTSHLDEYMWREIFGKTKLEAFNNIIFHLSQWYPLQ